ncbi:NAD-dependent epimerase/dehydratase family protein [Ruegeria atlantica]|uniref:NAD-dependent epimerase/dehydratase family protein n=1 Tax=Ruegeria atlantica TaxID=81569 RepID=UPI0020C4F495|nr:NAD-dependent epimerase/dehydratase family protein [Ruegeria atlantica]
MRIENKNVLVLGAYGFIGAAVTRSLQAEGAYVAAFVRNLKTGVQVLPDVTQVQGDLRACLQPKDWVAHLEHVDCVVNCAGAL